MPSASLHRHFEPTPFWWERSPPPERALELPEGPVDVLIVGAGYSGLFTALALARGGRSVLVLEADAIGTHASSRNFGAIGRTIRISFSELAARDGLQTAIRVYEEAKAWVEFTASFIERENIDCGFHRNGRVVAAHSAAAFDAMARELECMQEHIEVDTHLLSAAEQRDELGSDVYHGCAVLGDAAHLDPGRYLHGVLQRVEQAGAIVVGGTRVIGIERDRSTFSVLTQNRRIDAREVVLATNAETGTDNARFRFFRRRLVPVELYSAVTTALDPALLASVFPKSRTTLETRRLYLGLRPIESDNRLLVVGRHMRPYRKLEHAAADLKADLVQRYPALESVQFSHLWPGRFAVTFDWLPHLGSHDGIHYLMGLNGAGVPAAAYLGHKLAQRILDKPNRESVFADRPFPSRTGYTGSAWFLPPLAEWFRFRDRREARLAR